MSEPALSAVQRRPTLALVLIARDEAACIARCLQSVRPWVDAMVVLDTGSCDETVAIAQAQGAQVHHAPWCDDFAAARNAALDHSSADWNLVLDADEWLAGDGAVLRAAAGVAAAPAAPFLGVLPIHSATQAAPAQDAAGRALPPEAPREIVSWIPRLLPRGVRYAGRIHEQPVSAWPRRRLDVPVGHDGYLWRQLQRKQARNHGLLLQAVAEQPQDAALHYQLGKHHDIHGDAALAVASYTRALQATAHDLAYRVDLVVRLIVCLKRTGQHAAGRRLADTEMARCAQSPDFFYALADLLVDGAHRLSPSLTTGWLQLARISLLFCLHLGDRPDQVGAVQGRGSDLAASALADLDRLLAAA